MEWSDYLRQQEVIENCRQHYYDSMMSDIIDSTEDYDEDDDEYEEEDE